MAERVKLPAYIIYAFLNPGFGYSIPAHWVWDSKGWLNSRGVVDIAGSGKLLLLYFHIGLPDIPESINLGNNSDSIDLDHLRY